MKTLEEIKLPPNERAAIEEAAGVLRQKFPVDQIVLFGSKARGDDDLESDIDLLVLTTRPLSFAEQNALSDALFPLQLLHDVVLSPLVVPTQEWRSGLISVLPIHDEIDEQGVVT